MGAALLVGATDGNIKIVDDAVAIQIGEAEIGSEKHDCRCRRH